MRATRPTVLFDNGSYFNEFCCGLDEIISFKLSLVTFFSLFRNERKKSNQKKESAKGCRMLELPKVF
jgi:hypothetical protein